MHACIQVYINTYNNNNNNNIALTYMHSLDLLSDDVSSPHGLQDLVRVVEG